MVLNEREKQVAFQEGIVSGVADARLGYTSRYASAGVHLEPEGTYSFSYSLGYREGQRRQIASRASQ